MLLVGSLFSFIPSITIFSHHIFNQQKQQNDQKQDQNQNQNEDQSSTNNFSHKR